MARPTLWLGLTLIGFIVAFFILILLVMLGVFTPVPQPTLTELVDAATTTGPWTPFVPLTGALCQVYPAPRIPSTPEGFTNVAPLTTPSCVPSSGYSAAIQTQRTCQAATGCVDRQGIARSEGYVETLYQDCSIAYSCTGQPNCFTTYPVCDTAGEATVQVRAPEPTCVTRLGGLEELDAAITVTACTPLNLFQQYQKVLTATTKVGSFYSYVNATTRQCLIPLNEAAPTAVQMGPCGTGAWLLLPATTVDIPVGSITLPATVPSQLLWARTPATLPAIPTDYAGLQAFSTQYGSLQSGLIKPFIAACSDSPIATGILPTCTITATPLVALFPV